MKTVDAKNEHFFSHNWSVLNHKKKVRLVISVGLISIALVAFILFCGYRVASEKSEKLLDYAQGSDETYIYDL